MKKLLIIFLLGMLVYACKEKPTPKPEVCDVVTEAPEDFLNYFFYPEGSYWVYRQDSAGGLIDTLKIVRSRIGYFTDNVSSGGGNTGINTAVYQIWVEHTNPFFYVEGKPLVACFTGYSTNKGKNGRFLVSIIQIIPIIVRAMFYYIQ